MDATRLQVAGKLDQYPRGRGSATHRTRCASVFACSTRYAKTIERRTFRSLEDPLPADLDTKNCIRPRPQSQGADCPAGRGRTDL